jgi:hypothetical protein
MFKLCDELATSRSWDLEAVMPEAIAHRKARFAKEDAERKAKREAEECRVKNYIKKPGHAPPNRLIKTLHWQSSHLLSAKHLAYEGRSV